MAQISTWGIIITTNTKVSKGRSQNSNLSLDLEDIQVTKSKHDSKVMLRGDETPKVSSWRPK